MHCIYHNPSAEQQIHPALLSWPGLRRNHGGKDNGLQISVATFFLCRWVAEYDALQI